MSRMQRFDWIARRTKRRTQIAPSRRLRVEPLEARRMLATLTVNSDADGPVDLTDNVVTLRDALEAANNDVAVSPGGPVGSGADSIEFDGSLTDGLIRLTEGQLSVTDELTIDGAELGITITADAGDDDVLVAGTNITDVAASLAAGVLADNTRVLEITGVDSTTSIVGLTITGGRTTGQNDGAGIRNEEAPLTVSSSIVSGNTTKRGWGGGVYSAGPVTITDSTISDNSTDGSGADGGGIAGVREITLIRSTVSGNSANGGRGGGMIAFGLGNVLIINSTVSGNSTIDSGGGGIYSRSPVTLTSSTVTGNSTTGDAFSGGGISATEHVTLTNSIVSDNVTVNGSNEQISTGSGVTREGGTIIGSRLHNGDTLIETGLTADEIFAETAEVIDGLGNPTGVFAGKLNNNGGATATIALFATSAAFDTGDSSFATGIDHDQRGSGFARVADGNIDIGAYEVQTLLVDTLVDESDGNFSPGDFSLREALEMANSLRGPDTVRFDASLAGDVIRLTEGQLEITQEVTINGGFLGITISGDANGDDVLVGGTNITDVAGSVAGGVLADNTRVMNVVGTGSVTTIVGLAITGGRTTGGGGKGGGIRSDAALVFANSTLSGNSTTENSAEGGGIYSVGSVSLTNSTLSGNSTTGGIATGGGIFSLDDVSLTNSTLSGNSTTGGFARGGGVYSAGNLTLTNSLVTGNVTVNAGSDQVLVPFGSVIRQGGTIQGSTLRDGATTIQTGLTAADIFSTTTEVLDGAGAGAGVFTGVLAANGGLLPTMAILSTGAAVGTGDAALLPNDDFDLDGDMNTGEPLPLDANGNARIVAMLDIGAVEAFEPKSLVVTTLDDVIDATDFETSLREAINFANEQAGADTVTFDPSLAGGVIRLTEGQLLITDEITVDGAAWGITITADTNGDDLLVSGTNITDVAATLASNAANSDGIDNDGDGLIDGADTDGENLLDDNSRVFNVVGSNSTTSLVGLTITGGRTTENDERGGGLLSDADVQVTNSTVAGNSTAGDRAGGGGIHTRSTATITNSTVIGNSTAEFAAHGGGIFSFLDTNLNNSTVSENSTAGRLALGGGVYADGRAILTESTVSGNSTAGIDSRGGGIYSKENILLTNSTVSGNSTREFDANGGGLFSTRNVRLTSSTVSGNSTAGSAAQGGGISAVRDVTLTNSIVAGNTTVIGGDDQIYSTFGSVFHEGGTILGGTRRLGGAVQQSGLTAAKIFAETTEVLDGNGNATGVLTGVLGDNGGPTQTIALLIGGAAVDTGDSSLATGMNSDQRGAPFVRENGTVDIGAYEVQSLNLVVDMTDDVVDGDYSSGNLALREALQLTNGNPGTDTISFDADLAGGVINLNGSQLQIRDDVTVTGLGADQLTIDAGGSSRVLRVQSGTVEVSGLSLIDGRGGRGGGIRNDADAITTLAEMRISGNAATTNFDAGGGIWNDGDLKVVSSTISGNSASGQFGAGGGVFNSGTLSISNSTISGNESFSGGGVASAGDAVITHTTITGNEALAGGGGIFRSAGAFTVGHSLIAGNSAAGGEEVSGNVTLGDFNLIGDGSKTTAEALNVATAGTSDVTATSNGNVPTALAAILGPLGDNGGPTPTHALPTGSPAIDAGDQNAVAGQNGVPEFDQRGAGFDRLLKGGIDIGAIEAMPLSADFDNDGFVSGLDFLAWQRGFGSTSAIKADGDANNDTDVDGDDLTIWETQYGQPAPLMAALHTSEGTTSDLHSDLQISTLSEQAMQASLVDAAMASEWSKGTADETIELTELPVAIAASYEPNQDLRSLATHNHTESASVLNDDGKSEGPDKFWLEDELLERVFG